MVTEELPSEVEEQFSGDDWQGLSAVRNVAAHDDMQMRQTLLCETLLCETLLCETLQVTASRQLSLIEENLNA